MAYLGVFEPEITAGAGIWLGGKIEMDVFDPFGIPSGNIIAVEDGFKVEVKVELKGPGVGMLIGEWVMNLFLEKYGIGNDDLLATLADAVPLDANIHPGQTNYKWEFTLSSARLVTHNLDGAYRLIAVVTTKEPAGTPGAMAAYCEGPILQFFKGLTPP